MNINEHAKAKRNFKNYYVPLLLLFIITFIISFRVSVNVGDDEVFKNSFITNGGIIGWVKNYTSIWSGRVIPHFILIVLLNLNLIFWRLANSFMFSLMALGILLLTVKESDSNEKKTLTGYFICALVFFIPIKVLGSSSFWITGSVTYLWPMACTFIAIVPFKRMLTNEDDSKLLITAALLSTIYASYSEQSAAVMIAFDTLILIYCFVKKIKIKWYNWLNYFLCIANAIFSLTVVGNTVRSKAETLRFYPDYDMLSVVDKMFLGMKVTFNHLYNSNNLFMLLITLLIIVIIDYNKYDAITKLISICPLLYAAFKILGFEELYKFNDVNMLYVGGIKQYLSYIFAIMSCLIILYCFYLIFDKNEFIVISLMFLAALCCSLVMGFSPTVYASGNRIFFATSALLILCTSILFKKYLEKENMNKLLYIAILFIGLGLALRFLVFFKVEWLLQ